MDEPEEHSLRSYLNPVVVLAVLMLLSVVALLAAAMFGWDKGVLAGMSRVDFARGLITYLFAVVTIGTAVVLVVSALLGTDDERHERRFQRGKEILSLLLGVFGTIVGFYFGSEVSAKASAEERFRVLPPLVSATTVAPGAKFTLTTFVLGGAPPYRYTVSLGDAPPGKPDLLDQGGWIVKGLTAPGLTNEQSLPIQIELTDVKGEVTRRTVGIAVKPSP